MVVDETATRKTLSIIHLQTSIRIINMKIKEGFSLRNMLDINIIIAEGKENINFNKVISLNDSAAYLWNEIIGKDFTEEDMVKLLTDKYEVSEKQASADVHEIVKQWTDAGLI